jgi:hypothetical protein
LDELASFNLYKGGIEKIGREGAIKIIEEQKKRENLRKTKTKTKRE